MKQQTEKRGMRRQKGWLRAMAVLSAVWISVLGGIHLLYPSAVTVRPSAMPNGVLSLRLPYRQESIPVSAHGGAVYTHTEEGTLYLCGILPVKTVSVTTVTEKKLYPGGMLFGVRCSTEGVLVVGLQSVKDDVCPAREAGVRIGDVITHVEGVAITSVQALADRIAAVGQAGGSALLGVKREGKVLSVKVTPQKADDGIYRAGIRARDSSAGIGTVTFIDPQTCMFGGLGHGICDVDTGALLPLARGATMNVSVTEILRGSKGAPGELRGSFLSERTGTLIQNTDHGVFGVFGALPKEHAEPMTVGLSSEVHEGEATVLCTLDESGVRAYTARITRVSGYTGADPSSKNFIIEITDEDFLEKTGGIIQGMSGSPIIQNGKLVGAVTHVLINDPTMGYGIFIENMLNAAQSEVISKAA